jgi:hypothetical protein
LAAACQLTELGHHGGRFEAAPQAGGRARSYFDRRLGCRIDNGNHLLLSGNRAALGFLRRVGAESSLTGPAAPVFPFRDLASGAAWSLRLNSGRLPWWIFSPRRRVPGTRPRDYLALARLRRAGVDDRVAPLIGDAGALYRRLVAPLAIAALNTQPEEGLASLLGAVVRETLEKGGHAALPRWAALGLSESFVDPAEAWLRARGAEIRLGERVAALAAHHDERLADVEAACTEAQSAGDLLPVLFKRELDAHQVMFAMSEAIAHLNFLEHARRLHRETGCDGVIRFRRP